MPVYAYTYTDEQGGTFDEFQQMRDDVLVEHMGRPCERLISLPSIRTQYGKGSGTKPIELYSIGLNTKSEIQEFAKRNPNTQISQDRRDPLFGIPVVKSRSEKLRVLNNEGFQEKSSFS